MQDAKNLEFRIRRLEDRSQIDELIARYCFAMDNRDVDEFPNIFARNVVIRSADGVMNSEGLEAATDMFRARFKVLGPSNHVTHDRIVQFDANDSDRATGIVSSHAEMNRLGKSMLAAMRYADVYQRIADRWLFKQRLLSFFYYVPTTEYVDCLQQGLSSRMRAYEEPRPADWPEQLPTWKRYYD